MAAKQTRQRRGGPGRPPKPDAIPDAHLNPKIGFHVYYPEMREALDNFLAAQEIKMDITAIMNKILEDFLSREGFLDKHKKKAL